MLLKGEIWQDLEELRAEYSLRCDKYKEKSKEFLPESRKQLYHRALSARYLHAWCQLSSLLSCGQLGKMMEYEE